MRNIRAKFGIPNQLQSPDIGQNSDGCISNFQISGPSLIKENCHNSRTSRDIEKEAWASKYAWQEKHDHVKKN